MQTVPSLVGTSAAVAAAANGLVFGQAIEPESPSVPSIRPFSSKTRTALRDIRTGAPRPLSHSEVNWPLPRSPLALFADDAQPPPLVEDQYQYQYHKYHTQRIPISSRANANGASHSRALLNTQFDPPPKPSNPRRHTLRTGDYPTTPMIAEDARDSVSSSGSWIRRLSRPLSQHGSPRSSVCPESPSVSFSYTSGAPILSPTSSVPPSLPPNKLVKRTPSTQVFRPGSVSQTRQRTHLSLRRPATSHQRSATLQQFQQNVIADAAAAAAAAAETAETAAAASPKFSLDHRLPNLPSSLYSPTLGEPAGWSSFFHSHVVKVTNRTARSTDVSPAGRATLTAKRIRVTANRKMAHLMRPSMLSGPLPPQTEELVVVAEHETPQQRDSAAAHSQQASADTPDEPLSKPSRRSMTMHFSSPTSWIQKTGSIRRLKRSLESKPDPKRHVSAPTACEPPYERRSGVYTPSFQDGDDDLDGVMPEAARSRPRNTSSPIPPLSRLSSFNVDMGRLGPPAPILPGQHVSSPRHHQPSGSSQTSSALGRLTINSYDSEARCFTSTDDDETMWDSIRTGASARVRNTETPLESLFDESPPASACQAKGRRMSIHEMLGHPWDVDYTKIMEEDEGVATPVRNSTTTSVAKSPPTNRSRYPRGGGRVSLDEDFDDDWTKDDDDRLYSPLSPPSKGSSLNAGSISPSVRLALASISGNGGNATAAAAAMQRDLYNHNSSQPSELSSLDKPSSQSPRLRSVSIRHDPDKGGRPLLRRGMTGAHARSYSVPVVQDPIEFQKVNGSKFGTWGLGSKMISEDWDDDFDFENADGGLGGKLGDKTFQVPASIQATQPSVKAHSGQIKEFSILVNELKKLCRIGQELDLLHGLQSGLWKEAEGIIALASPDEAKDTENEGAALPTIESNPSTTNDRFLDDGFDAASLQSVENSRSFQDVALSKTTVIRERSSRRRSVFSPDDEIFGGNHRPGVEEGQQSRPKTPENKPPRRENDLTAAVHSVMEAVHHKASWDKIPPQTAPDGKMHFGTNSLKALVKRAGDLRDALSDVVRSMEPAVASSPLRTPRRAAGNGYIGTNGNPAFTRVFNDPPSSPPRRLPQSHSSSSILSRTSHDASPSGIGQCMPMMTVK